MNKKEDVERKFGKVLHEFTVPHAGWEVDHTGWICEDSDGNKKVVLTNHGAPYVATERELEKELRLLEKYVSEIEKALSIINPPYPDLHN